MEAPLLLSAGAADDESQVWENAGAAAEWLDLTKLLGLNFQKVIAAIRPPTEARRHVPFG